MAITPTGPGRVIVRSVTPTTVKVVLANYDIDGDTPKVEHLNFIDTRIVPALVGTNARIEIVGSASHSGTEGHNWALSGRRTHNVIERLTRAGMQVTQVSASATGESRATPGVNEHELDRSVTLYVYAPSRPPAPAPRPAAPANPNYQVRMLLSFGMEGVFGHDHAGFQVWDSARHIVAIYQYTGGNAGFGGGVSIRGPWNPLPAASTVTFQDLEGWARFGGVGALWWDRSYLILRGNPAGTINIHMDPFNTGFTLGVSLSAGIGRIELVGRPVSEAAFNAANRFFGYYNVP